MVLIKSLSITVEIRWSKSGTLSFTDIHITIPTYPHIQHLAWQRPHVHRLFLKKSILHLKGYHKFFLSLKSNILDSNGVCIADFGFWSEGPKNHLNLKFWSQILSPGVSNGSARRDLEWQRTVRRHSRSLLALSFKTSGQNLQNILHSLTSLHGHRGFNSPLHVWLDELDGTCYNTWVPVRERLQTWLCFVTCPFSCIDIEWLLCQHQSAPTSINQHQPVSSASTSINQHQPI